MSMSSIDLNAIKRATQQLQRTGTNNTAANTDSTPENTNLTTATSSEIAGLEFQGQTEDTRLQNTAVLNGMSSELQDIIKEDYMNSDSYMINFMLLAEDLNEHGYEAKVVDSNHTTEWGGREGEAVQYIEITDKTGQTSRLWDANGDGGFGKDDIDVNASLQDFKTDLNKAKVNEAAATNNTTTNSATPTTATTDATSVNAATTTTTAKESTATNKNNSINNRTQEFYKRNDLNQNNETQDIQHFNIDLIKMLLKLLLKVQGVKDSEIDDRVNSLLLLNNPENLV